ncbi:MAG: hypothetical protein ACOYI8_05895 [Christensenellales bacterium]|jgi:hypothetical protein
MKKILVCAVAALTVLSMLLPCLAEEKDVFTFAGCALGHANAEVLALENLDEDASYSMDEDVDICMFFEMVDVKGSKYTGDLVYEFIWDERMRIAYIGQYPCLQLGRFQYRIPVVYRGSARNLSWEVTQLVFHRHIRINQNLWRKCYGSAIRCADRY